MSEARAHRAPEHRALQVLGKARRGGNFPAVPSLSVTLAGLATRTRVRFDASLASRPLHRSTAATAGAEATARVSKLLDRVRRAAREDRRAEVHSTNDFPTASGLASSASGFAALALAAARAAGLDWADARVSDLARRSSASAARSLFGGFVELEAGAEVAREARLLAARPVASAGHLPLTVLVCVTTEAPKATGSSDGMRAHDGRSPYARAWLEDAPRLHARLRDALLARDFPARRRAGRGERARDARERDRGRLGLLERRDLAMRSPPCARCAPRASARSRRSTPGRT